MKNLKLALALAGALLSVDAFAQTPNVTGSTFQTGQTGKTVQGVVFMCLNSSGVAIPSDAAGTNCPSGGSGTTTSNITQWATTALGAPSNYGTSPGAVVVPGVNAFVTNPVAVTGTFFQATQPVSGTVTANAGTNLNTSLLALEAGGNLAGIVTQLGAVTASPTANTISDRLKTINATLGSPFQASGSIGNTSFAATQASAAALNATVVGTGIFAVQAAQSGAWNVTNISGTVSLPTGAATLVAQGTGNTSLSSIDGKTPALGQALAASSVPVVLTAAQITTLTPPAAIAGFALDTSVGTTNTDLGPPGATACATDTGSCSLNALAQRLAQRLTTVNTTLGTPLQAGGAVTATQTGTWTVQPGNTANTTPWLVTTIPSAAAGAGLTPATSSSLAANQIIKAGAGNLYSFEISADSTLSAAAWWVMIYNATSAPVDGAVTPLKCYAMASGSTSFSAAFRTPVAFSTGITIGVSTTGCFTKTASTHAFISGDAQ